MRCFRSALATALILLLGACGADPPAPEAPKEDAAASAADVADASTSNGSDGGDRSDAIQDAEPQRDAAQALLDASEAPHESGAPRLDAALDAGAEASRPDATSDASDAEGGAVANKPKEPFAVGSHWNEVDKYATLRAAGVQMMRIDLIWDELEPTQGAFDWPKIDRALAEAAKQGIKVLAVLGYTPSWARSGDSHNFAPRESFDTAWGQYIQATVSRYGEKVSAWEIWNEPDHDNFLKLGDDTWAKNRYPNESAQNQKRLQYKHLVELALAQPALSGKTLTTSGFAEGGNWDMGLRAWLAGQGGFFDRFDVASFHCYGYPSYQRLIDVPASYRVTQAALGKRSWPLWITEHGINTTGVPAASVKQYLIRTYALALAQPGVEKLFWFRAGYDPGHMDLFDASSNTTPAYDAYKTLTTSWSQPTQITAWSSGSARGSIATLMSGKRVAIVWNEGGAIALNALGLRVASATDQNGAPLGLESALTAAPVFLTLAE